MWPNRQYMLALVQALHRWYGKPLYQYLRTLMPCGITNPQWVNFLTNPVWKNKDIGFKFGRNITNKGTGPKQRSHTHLLSWFRLTWDTFPSCWGRSHSAESNSSPPSYSILWIHRWQCTVTDVGLDTFGPGLSWPTSTPLAMTTRFPTMPMPVLEGHAPHALPIVICHSGER